MHRPICAIGAILAPRMTYDADGGMVQIVSDKADGPTAGTRTFEVLEFLALLLTHVPRRGGRLHKVWDVCAARGRMPGRGHGWRSAPSPDRPVHCGWQDRHRK